MAVVAVGAGLAGCSSDAASDGSPARRADGAAATTTAASGSTSTEQATTTTSEAVPPAEAFTGSVDDFYRVPDPLPAGEPGQLIRIQPVAAGGASEQAAAAAAGEVTVRVMYHSRDARDRDRAVTGTITYPTATPPDGGWPVVAWAHGTTGLSSACAPSRTGGSGPSFGVEGVRVATDYIGLGPVGERHPYLSGASEAHSVIDAVRAARLLPEAGAGTRWVAAGHSQGGHAALFTNELGEAYAPELDLLGTAAIAPAAVLDKTFGPTDQVVPRMVGVMALYGLAADHPEIDPRDYVGPEVAAADHTIDDACADQVIAAMVGIPAERFYARNPIDTEPGKSILAENDPGHVAVEAPLLVVGGSTDTYVVADRVAFLFDQLCEAGQVTDLVEIAGAGHDEVVGEAADQIGSWMDARLAGEPAPDACRNSAADR